MSLLTILAGLTAAVGAAEQPIRLTAEPVAQGIRIQVIGAASRGTAGSFVLEVDGDGNRTVHRGSAVLRSGEAPVVLSTVTVGVVEGRPWQARLRVEPDGAPAYELALSSR